MGYPDQDGSGSSDGIEMGHVATAKAHEASMENLSQREIEDRAQLARMGKKTVLKRNFSFMAILGFSCAVLVTWEGSTIVFAAGLKNGGPSGVIYSFLIIWAGNLCVFSCLCELVSMAPTSGGQYHWVSMLAPRKYSKFLSYITGWLTVGGWQGSVASSGYLTGTMIQGLVSLTHKEYVPKPYQGTLLFWAVMFAAVIVNTAVSSTLPKFEGLILILHILGFFVILVPLVVLGPHGDASSVFNNFNNGGEWPTQGLSFMVGLIGNVFAFVGVDASFHMCEEVHNPSVVVPRSIMASIMVNGSTGFAMLLALLFCIGDTEKALKSPTGYPFMEIFLNATDSVAGSATMTAVIVTMSACCAIGMLASTSRVFWSFARDHGLPFWRTLSKVDQRTTVPIWAVAVSTTICCLLGLINIGSVAAFNNIVSLSVSCLYASYLMAASLLLYRRCTTGFSLPNSDAPLPALANTAGADLVWGPWRIPGVWGIINNVVACGYLLVIFFFSFWPPVWNVAADSMNYCALVTGFMITFSIVYYFVWGHKEYNGPIIET